MPYPRLPNIREGKDQEWTIQFIVDAYNKMRKTLEFLLRYLDDDNVLSLDASKIRNLTAEQIFTNVITAGTSINHVLYAQEGRIARLTVDHLLTGDFISGSEYIYFIDAQDQYLKFIIGHRNDALPQVHYTDEDDQPLYWDSAAHNYMTPLETEWPVMVYVYDLTTKLEMNFEAEYESGVLTQVPKIILGAGVGNAEHPEYGKGYIYKGTDGLLLKYITSAGKELTAYLNEDGIDIAHTATDDSVITLSLNDDGIKQTGSTGEQGIRNIAISSTQPTEAQDNDLWIATTDYSRYDSIDIGASGSLEASGAEYVRASGTITVTLFTAVGHENVIRIIKNVGAGTVTIDGYSSETIDGAVTKDLAVNEYCTIISNGANWEVIG